jgi:hypothetical protein
MPLYEPRQVVREARKKEKAFYERLLDAIFEGEPR